jgi:hypothetical protein
VAKHLNSFGIFSRRFSGDETFEAPNLLLEDANLAQSSVAPVAPQRRRRV